MDIICNKTKTNGNPCKAPAVAGQEQCIGHMPNAELARAKGGEKSSALARLQKYIPQNLKELNADLFKAFEDVHKGHISPQQGASMATLANSILRLYETAELNAELQEAKELIEARLGVKNG